MPANTLQSEEPMSDLSQKATEAAAKLQSSNPSVVPGKPAAERKRIPLSVPTRKLEVPEIPGYYLRWLRGTPQRLAQAERAGFEFVHPDEVQLNNVVIGGDASKDGNSDLGARVSLVEGSEIGEDNQAVRIYLMKQKMEHHLEDQEISQKRNESVADALTASFRQGTVGGQAPGEQAADVAARYVDKTRTRLPEFFRKKAPK
jgi:hypothetical protein